MNKIKREHEKSQKELSQLSTLLKSMKNEYEKTSFSNQIKNDGSGHFFVGNVLETNLQKDFIMKELKRLYSNKNVRKTELLFSFPLMEGLDPHKLIDNKEKYIVLIKLSTKDKEGNNYVIACYSEMALMRNGPRNDGLGFVASVNNMKSFSLISNKANNPRFTEYNDYFFIFGNSEIRFKTNEKKVDFNIGHNYRSLDTGIHKNAEIFSGDTS